MNPRLASLSHRRSPSESPAADPTRPAVSVGPAFAICLVAANLRTSLSWGRLLSTLPLLTFAATSPLVARASHRFGTARLLVAALGALTAGTVVRSLPSVICLFTGTVILSAAIAFGKVLLPALVRRSVPAHRIQGISALYVTVMGVTVMGVTAAVSSGISAPLSPTLPGSWHPPLAWGVAFTAAAFLAWLPRMRGDRPHSDKPQSDRPHTTSPPLAAPTGPTGPAAQHVHGPAAPGLLHRRRIAAQHSDPPQLDQHHGRMDAVLLPAGLPDSQQFPAPAHSGPSRPTMDCGRGLGRRGRRHRRTGLGPPRCPF